MVCVWKLTYIREAIAEEVSELKNLIDEIKCRIDEATMQETKLNESYKFVF